MRAIVLRELTAAVTARGDRNSVWSESCRAYEIARR